MKKVSFILLLKEFGICRLLLSWDLIFSFFLTVAITILIHFRCVHIDHAIFSIVMPISAALFGLLFTAFAIVISLSDSRFIKILNDLKIYNNLIFPFWYVSVLYLLSIIFDFGAIITYQDIKANYYTLWLYHLTGILAIFFTWYSLFSTFYRISSTVKIGIYRSKLADKMLADEKAENNAGLGCHYKPNN